MIETNLLSLEFFLRFEQNFTLITIFLVSYLLFRVLLKDSISKHEQKRRRERAEIYLNKYKNVDEEFFNENCTEEIFI